MKLILATFCVLLLSIQKSNAIINGSPAEMSPHNVMILAFRQDNTQFPGGGSLISDRHVLTSAFNVAGFVRWRLHMGSNRFDRSTVTVDATTAVGHPQYNPQTRINDIGVITMAAPVQFSIFIRPIQMPPQGTQTRLPLVNEQGTIVGFGGQSNAAPSMTNDLMAAFQRTLPDNHVQCIQIINNDANQGFCAEDNRRSSNACWGDQGTGFTVFSRDREILVGVVASGFCEQAAMSTYTRITHFRDWIFQQTQV